MRHTRTKEFLEPRGLLLAEARAISLLVYIYHCCKKLRKRASVLCTTLTFFFIFFLGANSSTEINHLEMDDEKLNENRSCI